MGMYGIFRVDPKGEEADKEYFLTMKEWDSRLNRPDGWPGRHLRRPEPPPDTFTIQREVRPRTLHPEDGSPIIVEHGDTVRITSATTGT